MLTTVPSSFPGATHFPPPPSNLQASWIEDQRDGYFGHAILNISWVGPTGMVHLGKGCYSLNVYIMFTTLWPNNLVYASYMYLNNLEVNIEPMRRRRVGLCVSQDRFINDDRWIGKADRMEGVNVFYHDYRQPLPDWLQAVPILSG